MPRVYLTKVEVAAISEALRWAVYAIESSGHQDDGKAARVAEARAVQQSFNAKARKGDS